METGLTDHAVSKFNYLEISPKMVGLFRNLAEKVISLKKFLKYTC